MQKATVSVLDDRYAVFNGKNIIIISDIKSGSDNSLNSNNNSHSNNSLDSFGSTSSLISCYKGISTFKEYVHSSPDIVYSKGPSNSLLNWYEDLLDEYKDHLTNAKPTFLDISKAKALILTKVQPYGSKAKASRSYSSKAKVQPSRSRAKASRSSYSKAKVKPSGSKAMVCLFSAMNAYFEAAYHS
ncbi:hypothetical protein Tco_0771492 [Tanacetum coccineum]|uniref:Uncharacterized protein n=1 Tax=Tanacetum coccineum TaxID=301880 RepID=A0ABQ4ZH51_9ASTR